LPIDIKPFLARDIITADGGTFIWINITDYVKNQLSSVNSFGFRMISDVTETNFRIWSKEHSDPGLIPELSIMHGGFLSNDASLSSLSTDIGFLDPAFDAGIFSYSLEVPVGTDSVHFTAITSHPVASLAGDGQIPCKAGTAIIIVTAEDGVTLKEYSVTIEGYNTAVEKTDPGVECLVYPNPASDRVYIKLGRRVDGSISLRNMLGQTLIKKDISSDPEILDLYGIETGIYFLTVESGNKIITTGKIIVR